MAFAAHIVPARFDLRAQTEGASAAAILAELPQQTHASLRDGVGAVVAHFQIIAHAAGAKRQIWREQVIAPEHAQNIEGGGVRAERIQPRAIRIEFDAPALTHVLADAQTEERIAVLDVPIIIRDETA